MADFIAVIRRAVDGLSDNTPEMRAKVYEKARSAVVRQLENMKPRPPEAMFQRQLEKLDEAIRQVEEENGEALPDVAQQEAFVPPAAEPLPEPVAEPDSGPVSEPEPLSTESPAEIAPVGYEAEPEAEALPEPELPHTEAAADQDHGWTEPAADEPVTEPAPAASEALPGEEDQVAAAEPSDVAVATETFAAYEPEAPAYPDQTEDEPEAATAPFVEPVAVESHVEPEPEPAQVAAWNPDSVFEDVHAPEPAAYRATEQSRAAAELDELLQEPVAPQASELVIEPSMPRAAYDENDVVSGFQQFVDEELARVPQPAPARKDDFAWDAPFDDLPELPKPKAFEDALAAKQKEIASEKPQARQNRRRRNGNGNGNGNARAELEQLIGFEEPAAQPDTAPAAAPNLPPEVARAVSKLEGKSYKVQKEKSGFKISATAIALAVAGVLVIGGGGFAAWQFRDAITGLFSGSEATDAVTTPADSTATAPADTQGDTKPAAADTQAAATPDAGKTTDVAALGNTDGSQKFTQRLMSDGTESVPDDAKLSVDSALPEGKSVAGQTEASNKTPETAPTADTKTADPAIAVTQKMFLYEERLGQTSPVAVPGTVVWKSKKDAADGQGKPEPAVVGQIDVPGRKMKILVTFNRNVDPSLPASHFIEIVFDLPKDFEDGNVESVKSVSFKQTEQDRGNALIGVPVKVTDDFHMIALNDDAAAIKTNLELMKSRAWIDIPFTYRNGRRALITLEKGATGAEAFDKVIAEWQALGDVKAN